MFLSTTNRKIGLFFRKIFFPFFFRLQLEKVCFKLRSPSAKKQDATFFCACACCAAHNQPRGGLRTTAILTPILRAQQRNNSYEVLINALLFCAYIICVTFVVVTDCESCTRSIFHKPGIYGSGQVWANAWDVFRRTPSRGGGGRRAAMDFVVCFGCGGILVFSSFFSSDAHGLPQA